MRFWLARAVGVIESNEHMSHLGKRNSTMSLLRTCLLSVLRSPDDRSQHDHSGRSGRLSMFMRDVSGSVNPFGFIIVAGLLLAVFIVVFGVLVVGPVGG